VSAVDQARASLDAHVRDVVRHHFSPETGTPFWIRWAKQAGWDPRDVVETFDDLSRFPPFDKSWLRDAPHADWVPGAMDGQPFKVFETGGTTGFPTQRPSWRDHLVDYETYAPLLPDDTYPRGAAWLILGPTGPRRLRLSMEHLANVRGGIAYHVDLDPRWVRRLLAEGDAAVARRYQEHVIAQAVALLEHREIRCVFTTPKLLEVLGERVDLHDAGIRGVLCGGMSMSPQTVRFLAEEVCGPDVRFTAVYGNTLMGLAAAEPLPGPHGWEVVYHAPQPRAVLRVVDDHGAPVPYGTRGRVELSTLTHEFFMPRLLERDEAIRREPTDAFPWDGVGDVRPFGTGAGRHTIEGVY
jgi:phenylacetate-coenzyme A ligase PaaK-like adenylate-forming protein